MTWGLGAWLCGYNLMASASRRRQIGCPTATHPASLLPCCYQVALSGPTMNPEIAQNGEAGSCVLAGGCCWLAGWLAGWLADCQAGWLDGLDGCLASWLAGLSDWLTRWLAGWLG